MWYGASEEDTPSEGYEVPERHTILVADDNALNREVLVVALEAQGFQVVTAMNGAVAVERACETCPSLILMDGSMPIMDGYEATRRIHSNPATANIPIWMVSANNGRRYVEEFVEA